MGLIGLLQDMQCAWGKELFQRVVTITYLIATFWYQLIFWVNQCIQAIEKPLNLEPAEESIQSDFVWLT